jgi:ABC-type sugar transport system substrate-binding protein
MIRIDITSDNIGEGKTTIAEAIEQMLKDKGLSVLVNHDNQHSSCTMRDRLTSEYFNTEGVILITDGGRYGDDDRDLDEDRSDLE